MNSFLVIRQGIDNDLQNDYPNVGFLQLLNTEYEKVNLELLRQNGILSTNARSVYCGTIVEDVIAKILLLARNYIRHFDGRAEKCRQWKDRFYHAWPQQFGSYAGRPYPFDQPHAAGGHADCLERLAEDAGARITE